MATIELDVSLTQDEQLESVLEQLTEGTDVTTTVITEVGPGGGCPIVEFSGSRMHLAYVVAVYAGPSGDLEYLLSLIEN